jgi:acetate kinase
VLGHADAVVFTAGVGENDPVVRACALEGLEPLGIWVEDCRNRSASTEPRAISPPGAAVAVLVMPTDEELQMAEEAWELVGAG